MMRFDPVGLAPHVPGAGSVAATEPAALQWRAALQRAARGPDGDALPEAAAPARPRVAWRDAGASSTWLAPVRERAPAEDERPAAVAPDGLSAVDAMEPRASDTASEAATGDARGLQDPRERRMAAGRRTEVAADAAGLQPAAGAQLQQALDDAADQSIATIGRGWPAPVAAASAGSADVPPAGARAAGRVAPPGAASAGPAVAALPGTAAAASPLPAPDGDANAPPDAAAAQAPGPSAAPRPAGQPFQATHLHIGPGDAGPTWWLRDASAGDAGAARLLQALAALAVPRELRPAAMFLNGRPLKEMPGRSGGALSSTAAPSPGAGASAPQRAGHDLAPSHPNIKEDPHGH